MSRPVLEFRGDDFSSTATMTPQETTEVMEPEDDHSRGSQPTENRLHPDEYASGDDGKHRISHTDGGSSVEFHVQDANDSERSIQSPARLPNLATRAKLVRTPANKDDRHDDSELLKDGQFEEGLTLTAPPPDVLITELKEVPVLVEGDVEGVDGEESDIEEDYKHVTLEAVNGEDEWDTDLEIEDERVKEAKNHDPSGRLYYGKICDRMGLVPVSYFTRHILDHEITMRWHGLGPVAAKAIALVLRDNITLEKLNIQGNWIEGEGGRAIARMLEDNDYITEINLADNKLCTLGAQCLCNMLSVNAGLRKLDLSGNMFDDKDAQIFADALENTKYLKELNLSRNLFSSAAGEILGPAIGANDILEVLDLSWNRIRGPGAIAVAKGLGENVRLKVCRLGWNGFGPEGGAALGEALAGNNSLLEVDISGNRLTADSAMKVSRAIATNDNIKIIRMGNNIITTLGAIALATSINGSESSELELLDLTDIPVEFEFLRILEDIKSKRPNFKVIHGPVLSSGNTADDIGKPGVYPNKRKEPVMILQNHIVVNDMRLLDILKKYNPSGDFNVTPEDFVKAVEDLAVPFNRPKLEKAVKDLADTQSGRIYFGDFIHQQREQEKLNGPADEQGPTEPALQGAES